MGRGHHRSWPLLLAGAALFAGAAWARAVDRYYLPGTLVESRWLDPSVWLPAGLPQEGDALYFLPTDTLSRRLTYGPDVPGDPDPAVTLASLTLDASGLGLFTLAQTGGTLAITGNESIGDAGRGIYIQTGGLHQLTTPDATLSIGTQLGRGTYLLNGGILSVPNLALGTDQTSERRSSMTVSGGTMTVSGLLSIRNSGTFTLAGGNLNVGTLQTAANRFLWSDGTLNFTNPAIPVDLIAAGSLCTLSTSRSLLVQGDAFLTKNASWAQTGGNQRIGGALSIGDGSAWGSYRLSGGSLTAHALKLASGNFQITAGSFFAESAEIKFGTLNVAGGAFTADTVLQTGGTISGSVSNTGLWTYAAGAAGALPQTFNNSGTLRLASGNSVAYTGAITLLDGTLDLSAPGAAWTQVGGTFNFNGGSILGTLALRTKATLNIAPGAGSANLVVEPNTLGSMAACTVYTTGGLASNQSMLVNAHSLFPSGLLATASSGTFTNNGRIAIKNNSANDGSLFFSTGNATLFNASSGVIRIGTGHEGTTRIDTNTVGGKDYLQTPALVNAGTLVVSRNWQPSQHLFTLTNTGLVQLQAWTTFSSAFNMMGGTLDMSAGPGWCQLGTFNFTRGTILGTLYMGDMAPINIGPDAGPATLEGSNYLYLGGQLNAGQVARINTCLTFSGGSVFQNTGTIQLLGSSSHLDCGTFWNKPSGVVNCGVGDALDVGTHFRVLALQNEGLLDIINDENARYPVANTGTFRIQSNQYFHTQRNFEQNGGTLDCSAPDVFFTSDQNFQYTGGTILGTPHIGSGTLNIASGVNPASFDLWGPVTFTGALLPFGQTLTAMTSLTLTCSNAESFTNAGVIRVSSTTNCGVLFKLSSAQTPFNNAGFFQFKNGMLVTFSGIINQQAGTLDIASADWCQTGGSFNYMGGTILGTPTLSGTTLKLVSSSSCSFIFSGISYSPVSTLMGVPQPHQSIILSDSARVYSADGANAGTLSFTAANSVAAMLSVTQSDSRFANMASGLILFGSPADASFYSGSARSFFSVNTLANAGTVRSFLPWSFAGSILNEGAIDINNTFALVGSLANAGTFSIGNIFMRSIGRNAFTLAGTLTNTGTFFVGSSSTIAGALVNTGLIRVAANQLLSSRDILQQDGLLDCSTAGGFIRASGSFRYADGTILGVVTIAPGATLDLAHDAPVSFCFDAGSFSAVSTLVGTPQPGQLVIIGNPANFSPVSVLARSGANAGTIAFTPPSFNYNTVTLASGLPDRNFINLASGLVLLGDSGMDSNEDMNFLNVATFTNVGTLRSYLHWEHTGSLVNSGTLDVHRPVTHVGKLANTGLIQVAANQTWTARSDVIQQGGLLDLSAAGAMWLQTGGTFRFAGGTILGAVSFCQGPDASVPPTLILEESAGPATFLLVSWPSLPVSVRGNLRPGQTIGPSASYSGGIAEFDSNFINAGVINTSDGRNLLSLQFTNAALATFTNSGVLNFAGRSSYAPSMDCATFVNNGLFVGSLPSSSGIQFSTLHNHGMFTMSGCNWMYVANLTNSGECTFASNSFSVGTFTQTAGAAFLGETNTSMRFFTLTLSGGVMTVSQGASPRALSTGALTLTGNARLDLMNNLLLVMDAGWDDFTRDCRSGQVFSSLADHDTVVAPFSVPEYLSLHDSNMFLGYALPTNTPNAKAAALALIGDADLSGALTLDDYARLDAAFTTPPLSVSWLHGDFNLDGRLDYRDYAMIDAVAQMRQLPFAADEIARHQERFGTPYLTALQEQMVPEPAAGALLVAGLGTLVWRRRGPGYAGSRR